MIKLYREPNSAQADALEAEFRERVLAYERVVMDEGELKRMFGGDVSAPVLTDNARVVAGQEMLAAYLIELKTFVCDWQLFQNNCCYVDDDGETR